MLARVKSHITRYERLTGTGAKSVGITVRGLRIEQESRRVFLNEKEVSLTGKEFDVLLMFASNPNRVYTKDKIEYDPSNPQYIETIWGIGYRFTV